MENEKQILVDVRTIYGRRVVYPACKDSETFCKLARTQSLTFDAIEQIKALGYAVIVKPQVTKL
jgi:hypothetical protein